MIRDAFGLNVVHLHLNAPVTRIERRYLERGDTKIKESKSYRDVRRNATERGVGKLEGDADAVIDTKQNTRDDVVIGRASHLGFYGREYRRLVDVLVGGRFAAARARDEFPRISHEYDLLIRVGGPNAGHTVHLGIAKKTFISCPREVYRARPI